MFSIQKLFSKDDKFLDLLSAGAEEAKSSVQVLARLCSQGSSSTSLEEFAFVRRKEKKIAEQISEELVNTFVTGLEREDIEALANALYKIPKATEKFAERFLVAGDHLKGIDFSRQTGLLEQAVVVVVSMVGQLRHIQEVEKVKELNDRLQYLEGEADRVMLDLLKDLYGGARHPLQVIVAKDLYELNEKVIDRCRDAGNVIMHVFLKNA